MKKTIIIILAIVVISLIIGAGYKFDIGMFFREYEEDCFIYKKHYWNETYCRSTIGLMDWKNNNEERPCCDSGYSTWCWGIPFNKTFWEFTDECDIYHVIRKAK